MRIVFLPLRALRPGAGKASSVFDARPEKKHSRALLRTQIGRRDLLYGLYYGSLPLLGRLAKFYRRTIVRRTRVVAVVGSFGKTSTCRAIRAALGMWVDPYLGVTQTSFKAREVLRIRPRDRHAGIETAIEGPGQMKFAAGFISARKSWW